MSEIVEGVVGELIARQVDGVIGMLVFLIKDEVILAWGFKGELEELKEQFTQLSGLLEGASRKPITNPVMRVWLNKIKNVAYDAENLLDEWSYDSIKKRISLMSCSKKDKLITSFTYPISRFSMAHKVRKVRKLICDIHSDGSKLGIESVRVAGGDSYSGTPSKETLNLHRSLHYQRLCVDDKLIGRDEDRTQLVKWICDPTNNNADLTVVGIVGFAGLGKTALSKQVCKAEEVSACFDSLVIWVVVSHSSDVIDCLNGMVEILFKEASKMKVLEALISKLQLKLKGKKYLLILDDVWDETFWRSFRPALSQIGGSKGSVILVTSRHINVVEKIKTDSTVKRTTNILRLQGLSERDSWSLFKARIIDDDNDVDRSENELLLARNMITSCGGVPLAIRALGDLLRDKSVEEWMKIEESEVWMKEDEHGILPILKLSYNYLPNTALKKCFAYCAIFKEDEVIEKKRLIYMWMAHGFLQPYNDEMEHRGEDYCKVLLNSSLFQEAVVDKFGNVKTFKMHDLVLSLARVVSMEEFLCSNGDKNDGSSDEVRHLSLPNFNRELTKAYCMKLHTLFHEDGIDDRAARQLKECRHLRVLKIGCFFDISMLKMLDSSFKNLRYLELESLWLLDWGKKMTMPNVKLYHLQTLWIEDLDDNIALFLKGIIKSDLVNLRHIHTPDSIGILEGLSRLTALQTLPAINLEKQWGGRIRELGLLNNLRDTLEIHNLKCSEEDASTIFSAGDNFKLIRSLILVWDSNDTRESTEQNKVLEAMQPHSNLKRLKISDYSGTIFPRWLTEKGSLFCNLASLTLRSCRYAEGCLQMENFKYLRFLKISLCTLGLSFPDHGFQCCKLLEELKLLGDGYTSFPDLSPLTKLRVLHYTRQGFASELVGLDSLPCLKELDTNQLLPEKLDEYSPLCKSLQILRLYAPLNGVEPTSLPMQIQYLVALQELKMALYTEETIPEWLGNLTALRHVWFMLIQKLKWLPSLQAMQRLSNLHTFIVNGCASLEDDIESKGAEWFKIAHIPHIQITRKRLN